MSIILEFNYDSKYQLIFYFENLIGENFTMWEPFWRSVALNIDFV